MAKQRPQPGPALGGSPARWPIAHDLNVRDELKQLTPAALAAYQRSVALPFAVAAINLNGDLNIGTMMRSAVLFAAERMFLFGQRRYDRRSTVGAHNYIELVTVACPTDGGDVARATFDAAMAEGGYTPVFFEQRGRGVSRFDFGALPGKPCLVFGNEGYGLSDGFIGADIRLSIPQRGVARSLNVSAAAAIGCFLCASQLGAATDPAPPP